jgi:XTP/dITP diphosphohydrolase
LSRPLLVATRSGHKLREIREIVVQHGGPEVVDLEAAGVPYDPAEESIEVHDTFAENARAKARYFAARSGTRTLADDSGICVDALGGAPGVRSKRFSGRDDLEGAALDSVNNQLLLAKLLEASPDQRTAHYVCVVALVDPQGGDALFEGRADGLILEAPRGAGGFGYDPLFYAPDEEATFAELDPARKNQISHRARAIAALARALQNPRSAVQRPPATRGGHAPVGAASS